MRKIKLLVLLFICTIATFTLVACGSDDVNDETTIVVGATSAPHAEILDFAKPLLEEKGYTLKVEVFGKYELLNPALSNGDFIANYFQHTPYLNEYNAAQNDNLVSVAKIHYEPLGLYGKGITDLNNVNGTTIFIPNDNSNLTRALLLLAAEGIIEIDSTKNINTGVSLYDVTNNKGNEIVPVKANTVPAQYKNNSKCLAVINGNYAIDAKISISTALATEDSSSEAASIYANIIAVKSGNENNPKVLALIEVLTSQTVKDYITSKYQGAVLPM